MLSLIFWLPWTLDMHDSFLRDTHVLESVSVAKGGGGGLGLGDQGLQVDQYPGYN